MNQDFEKIIETLSSTKQKVASMESCTGGMFADEITNIPGSSEVFELGLVTYSNNMKILFGIDENVIDEYGVYSIQTANEMAKAVSKTAKADWGIGITGQIGREDPNNKKEKINIIYYSIYSRTKDIYFAYEIIVEESKSRRQNKEEIIKEIANNFIIVLKEY